MEICSGKYAVTCRGSVGEKEEGNISLQGKEVEGPCGKGANSSFEEFCTHRKISEAERGQVGSSRRKRILFETIHRKASVFHGREIVMTFKKQSLMAEKQRLSCSYTMLVKKVSYLQDKSKNVKEVHNPHRSEIEVTKTKIRQTADDLNAVEEQLVFARRENFRLPGVKIRILDRKAVLQIEKSRLFKRKQTVKRRLSF